MVGKRFKKLCIQVQILSLYKQTNVYTHVIEISVILVKQSLYD